jgi:hypothetical protein
MNDANQIQQSQVNDNKALWERQFGPVSDALKGQMMSMLGQGPVQPESPWLTQYKNTMRSEIEGGIRPGEEAARTALLDRVRANPMGMSNQSFARGLKDVVTEGSKARGSAFRTGMSQAELTPFNLGLSFMGRTPYQPNAPFSPDYKDNSIEKAKAIGSGLYETGRAGGSLYQSLFGDRGGSGFEGNSYNGGTGDVPPAEGEVW